MATKVGIFKMFAFANMTNVKNPAEKSAGFFLWDLFLQADPRLRGDDNGAATLCLEPRASSLTPVALSVL